LSHETAAGLKHRVTGTYDLPHKTLGVIFNFDKMIGGEFEKCLAALKAQAEAR
jgi:hypothetical protein